MPSPSEIRRLALSCLLLGFTGPTPPPWLRRALADGLGGVVLFGSNVGSGRDVRELTDELRAAAGHDIVVGTDEEGGDVTRLERTHGSSTPGAAALGHLDDPVATEEVYAAVGARLAAAGITLDLAPVGDVNIEPLNPVIGVRSFGSRAPLAARHVAAAVRGVQRAGVAGCVKHFPGHGATRTDTHRRLATLDRSAGQLREVEFAPFRAAIDAGARAIMTGHLLAPALDADAPATFSPRITRAVLREELGFRGTVVTDALEMAAISATIGLVGGFVRALAAGADAIETGARDCPELVEALADAVTAALDAGQLTMSRLRDAAERTAALATAEPSAGRGSGYDHDLVAGVAARCVQVTGRLPRLVAPLVVECRPPAGILAGELPWSLADPLGALVAGTETVAVAGAVRADELTARARGRGLVAVVRDPDRHPWQRAVVTAAARHRDAVIVDVGWPTLPDGIVTTVRTRGVAPGLLAAAARILAGSRDAAPGGPR